MTLHKDLTGAEVHEPKDIGIASDGDVYVADGAGSGDWQNRYSGVLALNQYWLNGEIADISTANDHTFFRVPIKSELISLSAVLDGGITTANDILSVYINGVLFADSLTVPFTGSTVGTVATMNTTTANTISANSVIEIRSNGASDTAQKAFVTIGLRAKI